MLTAQQLAAGLRAFANAIDGVNGGSPAINHPSQLAPQAYTAPQPAPQPAPQTAPQTQATNVTSDMLTALIQPHVGNPQIKEALGAEMRGMGINALPETQPHQYAELYSRFQGVINRFTAGVPGTPGGGTASII